MGDDGGHVSAVFLGVLTTLAGTAVLVATALQVLDAPRWTVPRVGSIDGDLGLYVAGAFVAFLGTAVLRGERARARAALPVPDIGFAPKRREEDRARAKDLPIVDASLHAAVVPLTPREVEMHALTEKIRALDRLLQKAAVKLGTGELSPDGYSVYASRVRQDKAGLEAERQRLAAEGVERAMGT